MTNDTHKYSVSQPEAEILPNLPGLTTKELIDISEFMGFFSAQVDLLTGLSQVEIFDLDYLYAAHKKALGHLYSFAGYLRTVNMSKGGFIFPAARILPDAMKTYERTILLPLSERYADKEKLIYDLARSHAELLFIHPFREGNGRIARLLAMLIYLKQTGEWVNFSEILKNDMPEYIQAVQDAAYERYDCMTELFRKIL
jgi:cell filamentation protein